MSEKKYETTITDMPSPPRSQPTKARARSTSAFDMPQRSMTVPAKTKLGIASKTQFCDAPTKLDASISKEYPPNTRPVTAAAPSANTIGTDSAISTTKTIPVAASSMSVVSRGHDLVVLDRRQLIRGRRLEQHDEAVEHRSEERRVGKECR